VSHADELSTYRTALRARIESLREDTIFDIGLTGPVESAALATVRKRGDTGEPYTIIELAAKYRASKLVVVGEPGSGKTTLLASLARHEETRLLALQPMGLWTEDISLESLLAMGVLPEDRMRTLLTEGNGLVIFDAIDEARRANLDAVFEDLIKFMGEYPGNQYVLSCRTAELPPWVGASLDQAHVLPVSEAEIERHMALARDRLISNCGQQPELHDGLKDLCHNPLLLGMTLALYEEGGPRGLEGITSRARLYELFLDQLEVREQAKRPPLPSERSLTPGCRQEILGYLGNKFHEDNQVYVTAVSMERWLAERLSEGAWDAWWADRRPSASQLSKALATRPPMKGVVRRQGESPRYAFLHPTFVDIFAAKYVQETGAADIPGTVAALVGVKSRGHWEVVSQLCGLVSRPEDVTTAVVQVANEHRRQELFRLAAMCVRDCWTMPLLEADDVRLRVIDAFKYWDIPFDYDLMRAVKGTLRATGASFPKRLAEDLDWFITKYAVVVPTELSATPTDTLVKLVSGDNEALVIDAAYTLGVRSELDHNETERIRAALTDAAGSASGIVREQILAALKELASPESVPLFLNVIRTPDETPRSKAYALNGLGRVGDLRQADAVMEYMSDHVNPYRDSASWSLQALGRKAEAIDRALLTRIKQAYIDALEKESDDIEGRYAKGNMLYSLGVLKAKEFAGRIVKVVERAKEAYVVEDGINAVGLLGGEGSVELARRLLTNADPVVRMKAAEAAVRFSDQDALGEIQRLLSNENEYPIVREALISAALALDEPVVEAVDDEMKQALQSARAGGDGYQHIVLDAGTKQRFELLADQLFAEQRFKTRPHYVAAGQQWEVSMTQECFAAVANALL
jgi:HEAT repeat protein